MEVPDVSSLILIKCETIPSLHRINSNYVCILFNIQYIIYIFIDIYTYIYISNVLSISMDYSLGWYLIHWFLPTWLFNPREGVVGGIPHCFCIQAVVSIYYNPSNHLKGSYLQWFNLKIWILDLSVIFIYTRRYLKELSLCHPMS